MRMPHRWTEHDIERKAQYLAENQARSIIYNICIRRREAYEKSVMDYYPQMMITWRRNLLGVALRALELTKKVNTKTGIM